ncbi:MAG: aldose 1-epimerase [Acidobacteria bacterium]|nr:aldose 1-epimerase [Acidobacteriota bacterium]
MIRLPWPLTLMPLMSSAANYSASKIGVDATEVIVLADAARKTEVRIAPSIGNNAYSMKMNGIEVLWSPNQTLAEWKAKPAQIGNPFLAPWANRLDQDAFFANGKKYLLNPGLKNFRYDATGKPIHGLLVYASQWRVVSLKADEGGAETTSRLEFWREPDWMAQFPFAHSIEMTYRLRDGALEVETAVENLSSQPMPLSLAFHTYYRIADAPRDDWTVTLPARERVVLSDALVPTGERKPVEFASPLALRDATLDDVFTSLAADAAGRAEFRVRGKRQSIAVTQGPKYPVSVVYAPPGRDFICFEPMTGVTNAFNLAHEGKYPELQTVAPGRIWRESYWIRPEGY